ncbi:MAG: hypothetical protein AABX16_03950 [Nanoarchaeota archaeon]
MRDIGSDTQAQLRMLMSAYLKLRQQNPHHELLSLVTVHNDEGGFDFTDEYRKKCIHDTDRYRVQGYARYTFALEDALSGIEYRLLDTNPSCKF